MEVVSDFGTVDYFALETLTLGIFNVWLGMNNMPAAAQLALIAFILVGALLMIEIFARSPVISEPWCRPAGCADDHAHTGRGLDLYLCVFVACFYRVFWPGRDPAEFCAYRPER